MKETERASKRERGKKETRTARDRDRTGRSEREGEKKSQ